MQWLPHPGIGVCWETGKFCCFFSLKKFLSCSGATWLEQPQPVAIQLSLRDSSCAVLDRQACAPQYTEEPLLGPQRVTAPSYTLVGNFKQTG